MSWDSETWKQAARDYHADRPKLVARDGNRVVNGSDPLHDVPPAEDPDDFGYAAPKPDGNAGMLDSKKASAYAIRGINWFWPGRFALGKLGLIGGLPDKGKGLISADIIARSTTAAEWPCNEGKAPLGNVIWFTAEDDIEDTVIPRLVAAGADLDRVEIVGMAKNADGTPRMFNLATDLPLLRGKIDEVGKVALVIIDPVSAYLGVGKVNNSSTTDVRAVLAPLTKLAEENKISIIGIMKPVDPIEGMLISQIVAANEAALEFYRRGWTNTKAGYFDAGTKYLQLADKSSRTVALLTERLDQHRGRGQQQITVKHVTVNADQAVVTDQIVSGRRRETIATKSLTAGTDKPMDIIEPKQNEAMPVEGGGSKPK